MEKFRVLVIDDEVDFVETIVKRLRDRGLEAEGALSGPEGLQLLDNKEFDVIILDVNMPKMNGIEALDVIMREMPVPVIIVSSLEKYIIEETLEALEHGAVDFVIKPTDLASDLLFQIKTELISKVVALASLKRNIAPLQMTVTQAPKRQTLQEPRLPVRAPAPRVKAKIECVAIGVSTGGPTALYQIIPRLPQNFSAGILIVQHMPPGFTKPLADRMNKNCVLDVKEAESGDEIRPGLVLIAPGGHHMFLRTDARKKIVIDINREPSHYIHIPSIDITFSDVADLYRERAVGVILTGMGKDGVDGLERIKNNGGRSIAEDESTCVVFGMPEVAIRRGIVEKIAPIYNIADILLEMV